MAYGRRTIAASASTHTLEKHVSGIGHRERISLPRFSSRSRLHIKTAQRINADRENDGVN